MRASPWVDLPRRTCSSPGSLLPARGAAPQGSGSGSARGHVYVAGIGAHPVRFCARVCVEGAVCAPCAPVPRGAEPGLFSHIPQACPSRSPLPRGHVCSEAYSPLPRPWGCCSAQSGTDTQRKGWLEQRMRSPGRALGGGCGSQGPWGRNGLHPQTAAPRPGPVPCLSYVLLSVPHRCPLCSASPPCLARGYGCR